MTQLDDLPPDALIEIAYKLDVPDIKSYCLTSTNFNRVVCANDSFWRNRLKQDYNVDYPYKTTKKKFMDIYIAIAENSDPNDLLAEAARQNDIYLAQYAIERGGDINAHLRDPDNLTNANFSINPLVVAARNGNLFFIKKYFDEALPVTKNGMLTAAASYGHLSIIKRYIDYAKTARTVQQDSPLLKAMLYWATASKRYNPDLVEYIIVEGEPFSEYAMLYTIKRCDFNAFRALLTIGLETNAFNAEIYNLMVKTAIKYSASCPQIYNYLDENNLLPMQARTIMGNTIMRNLAQMAPYPMLKDHMHGTDRR